jgi:hypothetical protein
VQGYSHTIKLLNDKRKDDNGNKQPSTSEKDENFINEVIEKDDIPF